MDSLKKKLKGSRIKTSLYDGKWFGYVLLCTIL